MRTAPALPLVLFVLLTSSWTPGCGGVQTVGPPDLKIEDGQRVTLPGTRATMAIPKGMVRKDDTTFLLIVEQVAWLMLKIAVQPPPAGDPDAWIDRHLLAVQRSGRSGVLRNERVMLGDLDARLIVAEDLLGEHRAALVQIVAPAEDGVYVMTFFGAAAVIHRQRAPLVRALLSLRVPGLGGAGARGAGGKSRPEGGDRPAAPPAGEAPGPRSLLLTPLRPLARDLASRSGRREGSN